MTRRLPEKAGEFEKRAMSALIAAECDTTERANRAWDPAQVAPLIKQLAAARPRAALPVSALNELARRVANRENDGGGASAGIAEQFRRAQEKLVELNIILPPPRFVPGATRSLINFRTLSLAREFDMAYGAIHERLMDLDVLDPRKRASLAVLWLCYHDLVWDRATLHMCLHTPVPDLLHRVGGWWLLGTTLSDRVVFVDSVFVVLLEPWRWMGGTLAEAIVGAPPRKRQRGVAHLWRRAVETLWSTGNSPVSPNYRGFSAQAEAFGAANMEGFCVNHLRGRTRGIAARRETIARILRQYSPAPVPAGGATAEQPVNAQVHAQGDVPVDESLTMSALADRLMGVEPATRDGDSGFFIPDEVLRSFPTLERLFAWMAGEIAGGWPSFSSADRAHLPPLAQNLALKIAEEFGHRDIAAFEAEVILEFYEDAIKELSNARSRPVLCRFIEKWHRAPGMPRLNRKRIRGFRKSNDGVINTALVAEHEYHALLQPLVDRSAQDAGALFEAVLLILGRRIGLRRSEAMGLRLADIEDGGPWVLHISGELKTLSAFRWLPMADLMPAAELAVVQRLYWRRLGDGAALTELLIPESAKPRRLLDRLTQRIQEVTGDKDASYHTLRHTFANCLIVQAWRDRPGVEESVLASFFGAHRIPDTSDLHCILSEQRLASWAHQEARLIGHINPAVTGKHYLHVLDAVAQYHARRLAPSLTMEHVRVLMGAKKVQAAYKRVPPEQRPDGGVNPWDLDWVLQARAGT